MHIRRWGIGALVAAILAAGTWLAWRRQEDSGRSAGSAGAAGGVPSPSPGGQRQGPTAEKTKAALARIAAAMAQLPAAEQTVRADQVIVRVNGAPVVGGDLVPFRAGIKQQSMSREQYISLVGRAIERELVLQRARAGGIGLTAGEERDVEAFRAAATARKADPAAIDFDARDATGKMLLERIAAKAGVPAAMPGPSDVKAHYEGHREVYGELPADAKQREAAMKTIETKIRQEIEIEWRKAHAERVEALVDGMKAQATITLEPPARKDG